MFYLHVANRTQRLLQHLAHLLATDRQEDLFAPELFLIQSQGMERMLAQSLAASFGSFCNFRFFLPLDFLSFIAARLDMEISPDGFGRQSLTWRLDQLLRDIEAEEYQPLRHYLAGENSTLKRFQLAHRLANIFDQYQVLRPDMLRLWENGERAGDHAAELWQMALWRRLLASGNTPHRGMQFQRIIERLGGGDELAPLLPKRISVFGLHTMPPIFLEYLNKLAGHMDIHLFLLSPCRHYWGDVESLRTRRKRLARQTPMETPVPDEHHPLLAALGRQGRDFHNMLLERVEFFEEFEGYEDPLEGVATADASLLLRVQADLLEDRVVESAGIDTAGDDDSIQIVSCHSRLRELQVLKDHLLRLLYNDSSLELRQIIVMAPDIQEYSALIPTVFAEIQHSIADRSLRRRNSIIAAFLAFFNLFIGRFGWSEVFDLLCRPEIFPQFQLTAADLDSLRRWIIESGIRWGLSGEQRAEEGMADFAESSWRAGLDRLLMGYGVDSEELIDNILPYTGLEGRGAQPLGGLCRFIDLLEQAREDFRRSRTLAEWSLLLLHYCGLLFGDGDDRDLVELQGVLSEPFEEISSFHDSPVDFPVIRSWLSLSARESRSSSGFLRGQLTFCSMLPMRSIPFPVVCLLGLNDGVFPRNDRHDTFDLMAEDFRPGDRSPRDDDRYQFLEALLAAGSHFYLSYVGQSIRSGEIIPPSTVLSEFLELLESAYGAGEMVVRHPLHPFSRRYFSKVEGTRGLFSYNGYYCRTAMALRQAKEVKGSWWQGRIAKRGGTVAVVDLLRFAAGPQKFFLRDSLGIRPDLGEDIPEERELFESTGLDRYLVDQELLQEGLAGRLDDGLRKVVAKGLWPLGAPGNLAFAEKSRIMKDFLEKVEALQMGPPQPALVLDSICKGYRLVGSLNNLYAKGILLLRFGKLRGRDLLTGWIYHRLIQQVMPGAVTAIVALDDTLCFHAGSEGPELPRILDLFIEGCCRPLPFFLEPAFAYARQDASPKARTAPFEKALASYRQRMEKGYEPEWQLLYGDAPADKVLDGEFIDYCRQFFCTFLRVDNGS